MDALHHWKRTVGASGGRTVSEGRVFPLSPKRAESWAAKAYGRPLPKNGARHSFVSYHLSLFENTELTALQAGHSREILFRHYRELATRDEAESYFTIHAIL